MTIAWFIAPYKQRAGKPANFRYCSMDDFTPQIVSDGGDWAESEVLGNVALVKARASDATLTLINSGTGVLRIPGHFALTDTLSDLTNTQQTAIVDRLKSMGYSLTEIRTVMPVGGWGSITLGQVLRFAATRRLLPRFDVVLQQIILDGAIVAPEPIENVDAKVR